MTNYIFVRSCTYWILRVHFLKSFPKRIGVTDTNIYPTDVGAASKSHTSLRERQRFVQVSGFRMEYGWLLFVTISQWSVRGHRLSQRQWGWLRTQTIFLPVTDAHACVCEHMSLTSISSRSVKRPACLFFLVLLPGEVKRGQTRVGLWWFTVASLWLHLMVSCGSSSHARWVIVINTTFGVLTQMCRQHLWLEEHWGLV